jgi:colicin import membrane protein
MAGNSGLKKLLDPQSYGLPIALAVILHLVVIGLFAVEWPKEKRQIAEPTPKNIQAKVIQTESKQSKQRKLDAEQRRKNENWKKHLAKKKAAREKAAKDKAAKNKAKRLADKKKAKALKDKALKKAEDFKKAAALKEDQLAKQKKLEEQEAFDAEQEQLLMEAMAAEEQQQSIEKAMAAEQTAQNNAAVTNDVAAQIRNKISQAWRYPPSARPDMEVVVRIQLVPTGEVVQVSIITGSGNEALDRSVLAAVNRAQPLPVPKDNRIFEQQFRNFVMAFRPEDAVW